jgi:hypothetical protein
VTIELPHARLFVRVRHTTKHGESYLIGCSFLNKLTSDGLEAFLQVAPPTASPASATPRQRGPLSKPGIQSRYFSADL